MTQHERNRRIDQNVSSICIREWGNFTQQQREEVKERMRRGFSLHSAILDTWLKDRSK